MKLDIHRSTVFFVMALLVMAGVAAISFWSNRMMNHAQSQWGDAIQDMRHISTLRSALLNAETGQRGFLLTGDDRYLAVYRNVKDKVDRFCRNLVSSSDTEEERELAREVHRLTRQKMAELDQTLREYRQQGEETAIATVRVHTGKHLMDQIRDKMEAMLRVEREQWRFWHARISRFSRFHMGTVVVGNLLALILIGIAFRSSHLERIRREHYERSLISARQMAESANRAKAAFLANMSHELRTPLNAIIGFSEILAKGMVGPPLADRQQELVTDILDSGKRLLGLINDILDLSMLDAGDMKLMPRELPMPAIMDRVRRLMELKAAKKGIDFQIDGETTNLRVFADERALLQIMVHVIENAVKFTPEGGLVTVSALPVGAERIAIRVMDNGPGIPADVQERLFQPFERGDSSLSSEHAGAGLGLYLSRSLATLQQGSLWLESEPGVGTTVIIELPTPTETPDDRKRKEECE